MANSLSDDSGMVTDKHIDHYVRRAQAGVGMVIVEHAYIQRSGRVDSRQLGIHDDAVIPGLRRLAETVRACDTVVGIQITHGGGKASLETAGSQPVSSSDGIVPTSSKSELEPSRALTGGEIDTIVNDFVKAAQRAIEAGFDFVEVHGAHGYLLNQFMSPLTNRRTDDYGGSLDGRLQMPLRVVKAVRQVVDEEHLLLYRLGANDFMDGGLTAAEGLEAAKALVAAGVDVLDISGGLCGSQPPDWDGSSQGYFVPMASAIRAEVDAPVVVAGGITDPLFADRVTREGKVDLVAIGRAMLKNPEWAEEARKTLMEE
jgi:2,4-dienoyl-CoA reductase-like NADH-dependent reductase (Old Yellow Enzyme family)